MTGFLVIGLGLLILPAYRLYKTRERTDALTLSGRRAIIHSLALSWSLLKYYSEQPWIAGISVAKLALNPPTPFTKGGRGGFVLARGDEIIWQSDNFLVSFAAVNH